MQRSENSNAPSVGLPYVNNVWVILGTAAINILLFLLSFWGRQPAYWDLLATALICGAGTSLINVLLTHYFIQQMRRAGQLPAQVPTNRWVRMLPKNKWLLILLFAVVFGVAAALLNAVVIWFFQIGTFRVVQCAVWLGVCSCLLSVKITQFAILRFVQADCALPGQPPQTGDAKVVIPLPKFSAFGAWFNTVTDDFGFNMVVGLLSGGTLIADQNVIITPTTLAGIVISSLVLGVIVTFRMAYPIAKSMYAAWESGSLPPFETRNGFLSALPRKPMGMTLTLMLPIMLLSLAVFWSVLTFFDFKVLNFFQFFAIRTLFVTLLTKGVVAVMVARYRQPANK